MAAKPSRADAPEAPEFKISRDFAAPRALVWQAWTDPKQMQRWWGPRDFTSPVCELDVHVDGAYRLVMRSPEGKEYPMSGVFREVAPPSRLVLTMDVSGHPEEWHDLVNPQRDRSQPPHLVLLQTVTFEDLGAKTRLTVRTTFDSVAIRNAMLKTGMTAGWSESLERLAALLVKA